MPDAKRPITYSRLERLEARASHLRAQIADSRAAIRFHREYPGKRYRRFEEPCGEVELELSLAAMRKNPGTTFDECLAALRAGQRD